ncbi:hypothetical protein M124_0442 [Bacteroides fragilis str. 3988T(B)14]|uniref:Uncharacterized protein n=1 Tax=Bacteroides fragilis str. 3988T(B)14 TaxID=1339315 RepID=A0A015UPG7_BACFG|nr:hypothetical protein M124_0442 [Bacteroides fragilis str. 3988T(B)14]
MSEKVGVILVLCYRNKKEEILPEDSLFFISNRRAGLISR